MKEFRTVILAAGEGKRMQSSRSKVLHELCGLPLLEWVLRAARVAGSTRQVVVVGAGREEIMDRFAAEDVTFVVQENQLGTGHAVLQAQGAFEGYEGLMAVLCGDVPLIRGETMVLLAELMREENAGGLMASFLADDPTGYGRVRTEEDGRVIAVIEDADCVEDERLIEEVNSGTLLFDSKTLFSLLPRVGSNNSQGEHYLPDVFALAHQQDIRMVAAEADDGTEFMGINTRTDLAEATAHMRMRIARGHMENGVTIVDPRTTYIEADVIIERDARILPFSVIHRGARIGAGCSVGPFSHVREGTVMHAGSELGNFVETKKAELGSGSKAKHLTYLGDVTIGQGANIGAGTVVCNYDGVNKHHTEIGDRAFIGSGSLLVAPVRVGVGAGTGAGAVVTRGQDVPDGETAVGVPARLLKKRK